MPESLPHNPAPETPVNAIISLFGGVRPLAKKMNLTASTVQGWKIRNHIPEAYHVQLQQIANDQNTVTELDTLIHTMTQTPKDPVTGPETVITPPPAPAASPAPKTESVRPAQRPMPQDPNYRYTSMPQATMKYWILSSLASFGFAVLVIIVLICVFFGQELTDYVKMYGFNTTRIADTTMPVASAQQPAAPFDNKTENLEKSREAINHTLDDVRKIKELTPATQTALHNDLEKIEQSVADLRDRVDNMDKSIQQKSLDTATIDKRINTISQRDILAAGLLLGVAQLHRMMDEQSRFSDDLVFLKALLANDPEMIASIDKLAPFAATGLMSRDEMISTLGSVSREAIKVSQSQPNLPWHEKIRQAVHNVIEIRRTSDTQTATAFTPYATLKQAQELLADNQYGQAAQLLKDYTGPGADKVMAVAYNMQGRAAAQNLLDGLIAKGKALVDLSTLQTQLMAPAPFNNTSVTE